MMRIYIAAKYGRRKELIKIRYALLAMGHEVTARWLDGEDTYSQAYYAQMDVDDVLRADACLSIVEPYGSLNKGGGRHFEFGLAYGAGKKCFVLGGSEMIFHHLPSVIHINKLEELQVL